MVTAGILTALGLTLAAASVVTFVVIRYPRIAGRGRRFALTVCGWMVFGSLGDTFLLISHIVAADLIWRCAAIGVLLGALACGSAVMRRLHPRWLQLLCDAWLIGGGLLTVGWTLVLTLFDVTVDGAALVDLAALALSIMTATVALVVVPGRGETVAGTLRVRWLRWGAVSRCLVVALLLTHSVSGQAWALSTAAGLVVASNAAHMVTGAVRSDLRLAASRPESVGFDRYLPVLVALVALAGSFVVLSNSTMPRGSGIYALLALVVVGLGIRQVLTARESVTLVRRLGAGEEHYRNLVHRSTDVILICSLDARIEYASPAALTVLDMEPTTTVGRTLGYVLGVTDATVRTAVATAGQWGEPATLEAALPRLGSRVHLETLLSVVDGRIVCNIRDVTERAELQAQLRELAYDDALTGLPNRTRILEVLGHTVDVASRGLLTPAVLFIDLDGFKNVNDAGGHAAGDRVLAEVGARLAAIVPTECFLGRLGGDEFVVVMPDSARRSPGDLAAEVIDAIRPPYSAGPAVFVIGASVGVARYSGWETADTLLQNADLAVYQAKRNRRGWVLFEPAMHDAAVAKATLDAELADALAEHRVVLHYQPILDLVGDRIVGAEALLRWIDRTGAVRSPSELLDFAERTGALAELTHWVLTESIQQSARWSADGLAVRTSINLRPAELRNSALPELITELLSRHSVAPSELCLEITEQSLFQTATDAGTVIRRLAGLGVLIAVDDFGTGYSSLQYLIDLPVGALKIDRGFVARLGSVERADVLVSEIIRAGERLGLQVIAEGVESAAQRDRLIELGALMGQGFLFAKALPGGQFAAMAKVQGVTRLSLPLQRQGHPAEDLPTGTARSTRPRLRAVPDETAG